MDASIFIDEDRVYVDVPVGGASVEVVGSLAAELRSWLARASVQGERSNSRLTAATRAALVEFGRLEVSGRKFDEVMEFPASEEVTIPTKLADASPVSRRSVRDLVTPAISDLGDLFFEAGRIRDSWLDAYAYPATIRKAPSAGARHPLEIFVAALDVTGLERGLYWYDAVRNSLRRLSELSSTSEVSDTASMLMGGAVPPVVILLAAQVSRTLAKYKNGFSLVLLDAGALLATLARTATDVGLASCCLAFAPSRKWNQILGLEYPNWVVVSALAVGKQRA